MIDTKELRKLVHRHAQAAISIPIKPAMLSELLDRLEAAESEALEEARLNGMGSEREAALMAKLEKVEKERDELMAALQRIADGQEMSGVFTFADVVLRYQEIARAAIARATGEQP